MSRTETDPPRPDPAPAADDAAPGEKRKGFFRRLRERLNKGDSWLTYDLAHLLPGGKVGEEFIEEMETRLLTGDVGVDATQQIVEVRHPGGGRQRRRQDHHHRQAGAALPRPGTEVMLAAGDTFRAAAVEQLQVWGQRNDVPVIARAPAPTRPR
jgi:fused signal recognition particle receptor